MHADTMYEDEQLTNKQDVTDHFTFQFYLSVRTVTYLSSQEQIMRFSYTGPYDWVDFIVSIANHKVGYTKHQFDLMFHHKILSFINNKPNLITRTFTASKQNAEEDLLLYYNCCQDQIEEIRFNIYCNLNKKELIIPWKL